MTPDTKLLELYKKTFKVEPETILELTAHGSSRQYCRLQHGDYSTIGTISSNIEENKAFVALSNYLKNHSIPVPNIYAVDTENTCYIQEDCGDKDLYSLLKESRDEKHAYELLQKAVDLLLLYQKNTSTGWDYKNSYPFESFDEKEIERDFERFVKKLLLPLGIEFGNRLQQDKDTLIEEIQKIPQEDFCMMHRDFQARNILVSSENYILIDFQNCRKGPRYYDLASLLFQSQIDYSFELREKLIGYYFDHSELSRESSNFYKNFYLVSVVRLLQSLGSYGIAGLEQNKEYYRQSIPLALKNLKDVLSILETKFSTHFINLQKVVSPTLEKFEKATSQP